MGCGAETCSKSQDWAVKVRQFLHAKTMRTEEKMDGGTRGENKVGRAAIYHAQEVPAYISGRVTTADEGVEGGGSGGDGGGKKAEERLSLRREEDRGEAKQNC